MILVKKSENIEFCKFSVFLKNRDFTGFSMENWLYLGARLIDFDSKPRFGKNIKFPQDIQVK
jgi:hypothetical protein